MILKNHLSALSEKAKAFSVERLINVRKEEEGINATEDERAATYGTSAVQLRTVTMELCSSDLWDKFSEIGTEMIVTKAGRRMFPTLKVRFHGLSMTTTYIIYMDIIPVGKTRYRYIYHSSQWMASGTSEACSGNNIYVHPDSPATGRLWISQGHISFDKIKLTNNKKPIMTGQITLNSMHKYQPRIHILEVPISDNLRLNTMNEIMDYIHANRDRTTTFTFKQTAFITVTAYQNQEITQLKIQSNPFAKGFRETSKLRDRKTSKQGTPQPYARQSPCGESYYQEPFPGLTNKRDLFEAPSWYKKAPLRFVIPPMEITEMKKAMSDRVIL